MRGHPTLPFDVPTVERGQHSAARGPALDRWDEKRESFLLGNECIGGSEHEHVFELDTDEAARTVCARLG